MREKLRGIFRNHIYPLVKQEFGWLFKRVIQWLDDNGVELYVSFVSGVTAGKLFWPRPHTDPDVWYTVLVCLDYGKGVMLVENFLLHQSEEYCNASMAMSLSTIHSITIEQMNFISMMAMKDLAAFFIFHEKNVL